MQATGGAVWTHDRVTTDGVSLHYVEAGEGPPVVLLHGFPEFWYSWQHQIRALSTAGYRVIAPDLRGYNTSDKPDGVRHYRIEALVGDVAGVIERLAGGRAAVVGHDWGGVIAWVLAMTRPRLVERLAVLNAPHPALFRREIKRPRQALRSWYMAAFQMPWLPEAVTRARRFAIARGVLRRDPVRPGTFTATDIERYVEALAQPGALTAAINYYRALFRNLGGMRSMLSRYDGAALVVWGERDRYLVLSLLEGLDEWVPQLAVQRVPDAGHWIQNEAPREVNAALRAFLKEDLP